MIVKWIHIKEKIINVYIVTSARALILLSKTGSLDNAIQEFPLAWPLWVMNHHIISSVIHTFWLVLTYDLLEDRHIDDVIIKTFFNSLLYKTNRFLVTMHLFSNRSQIFSNNSNIDRSNIDHRYSKIFR